MGWRERYLDTTISKVRGNLREYKDAPGIRVLPHRVDPPYSAENNTPGIGVRCGVGFTSSPGGGHGRDGNSVCQALSLQGSVAPSNS